MSTSPNVSDYKVNVVHNALFVAALNNSVTALSLPISSESGINWAGMYVINNKPTQIEGI